MTAGRHALLGIEDGLATITLNRPDARNALSEEMRADLDDHLAVIKAEAGNSVRAVLLTGAGRSFCAGGDVKAMGNRSGDDSAAGRRTRLRSSHHRFYDLLHVEVPVIAAVNGHAAGAGFALALMADFLIAGPSTRFACSFGRIGLVPDWGCMYTLPRVVGLQKAKDLIFTGRTIDAEEARAMGVVHEIAPTDEGLVDHAAGFARRFCDASTHAIGVAKTVLNQSYETDHRTLIELEAFGQGVSYETSYHADAVARFRDKRPAAFDWERSSKGE